MTQLLAKDDAFTEHATHFGTYLAGGYLRCTPWGTASLAHPSAGSYSVPSAVGNLFSGYFGVGNVGSPGIYARQGQRKAAFTSTAGQGNFCAALRRDYYSASCTARLCFSLLATAGAADSDSFRWAGITVRNSAGTHSATIGAEKLGDTTGYWFLLAHTAALGSTFYLLRVVAGVVTVVDSKLATTVNPNWSTPASVQVPRILTLFVEDIAGVPTLTATTSKIAANQIGDAEETPVFTAVADPGGITAAGRAGFGLCNDRDVSGTQTTTVAQWFEITDTASGDVVHRDEWDRGPALVVGASLSDGNGKTGRNLGCGWRGDVHTAASGGFTRTLLRDAGANRVYHEAASNGQITDHLSTRPASNPVEASRSAVFQIASPSSQSAVAGLSLRGNVTPAGLFASGFRFELGWQNGPVWRARLLFLDASGGAQALVESNLNPVTYSLALGSDFTLALHVENVGVGAPLAGNASLTARVNGTLITWTAIVGPLVAEIQNDKSVHYLVGTQPHSGVVEGIHTNAVADSVVTFDTWTDAIVVAPGDPGVPGDEEASIAVTTECTGKFGTLTVPLTWPVRLVRGSRVERLKHDSGHTQRLLRSQHQRRVWSVQHAAARPAEKTALLAFWDSHKGVELPFDWVEPDGETVAVRFKAPRMKTRQRAPLVHAYDFELEEVFC